MYCFCVNDWTDGTNVCQNCNLIRNGIMPEKRFLMEGKTLNDYAAEVHIANKKWWLDLTKPIYDVDNNKILGYEQLVRNVPEMLCLVHSEISEALEGHRKNLQDDKLPHRKMIEVELTDAVIRIFDICAGLGFDLEGAYKEKMAYNAIRADHKIENRLMEGGKKF